MNIRVFIVDGEKDFAQTLAQRLELRDCSVTPVFSGQYAMKIVEKAKIDNIIKKRGW